LSQGLIRVKKKKSLKKRIQQRLLLWLIPVPVYFISRILFFTLKKELIDCDEFIKNWKSGEGLIVVMWHNRALLGAPFYLRIGGGRVVLLASQSFEGLLASRIFRLFGAEVAWGSSTRGGDIGMIDMIGRGKKGYHLAITPDGPLGPVYKLKPGAIRMAKDTGFPIVPWTYYAENAIRLNSWDRFIIPRPFSRAVFACGRAVYVPADADEEMMEQKRKEVEDELNRVSRFTEDYFSDKSQAVA
jgi:lysophospholipid acyltransferase (LPLAT)-like uncharacterized protein